MSWQYLLRRGGSLVALAGVAASQGFSCSLVSSESNGVESRPSSQSSATFSNSVVAKNPRIWVHDALEGEGKLIRKALGVEPSVLKSKLDQTLIFSGSSNRELAEEIAYELHRPLGRIQLGHFADGETSVQVLENVRGKDVYIIQSTSQPVNETIMELCLMVSSMRRASAASITAVIPYYGYKRDTGTVSALTHLIKHGVAVGTIGPNSVLVPGLTGLDDADAEAGSETQAASKIAALAAATSMGQGAEAGAIPVSAATVARMLETVGVDRIIAIELQPPGQGEIEGFFSPIVPVESLRATGIAVDFISRLKLNNPVVVAPNESCIQLAHDMQAGLQRRSGSYVGLAAIMEAGPSRGSDRYAHAYRGPGHAAMAGQRDRMELVGDVYGRDVIICDDMIDTGKSLMARLNLLRERGAKRLVAYATHGLFNEGALHRINKSALSDVVVTNTVPLREDVDVRHTHKIAQLSVAPLLAEAIIRVQTGVSMQDLRVFDRDGAEPRYKGQE